MVASIYALDHLVMNVADVNRSAEWFCKVLGAQRQDFQPGEDKATRTAVFFGAQKINLRPADADTGDWFTGRAPTPGSDDLCFLTPESPDSVVNHLKDLGVAIVEGPVTRQGARGALRSVYCRDPDGNLIELSSYAD